MKAVLKDLSNQQFGRLIVISRTDTKNERTMWICQCQCGNYTMAEGYNLRSGHTKSCGCYNSDIAKKQETTHNLSKTRLYRIWLSMKARCYNTNMTCYKYYGGRRILVCHEWIQDFMIFYNWAVAHGYRDNLTIDRINNDGNYDPSNCRWATYKEQANNKRNSLFITYQNKTLTINQWCESLNLNPKITYQRITRDKWSIERAFTCV